MNILSRFTAVAVVLVGLAAAQQVQQLGGNGQWSNTNGTATNKVPASDFGEFVYDGQSYFVWEIGNVLYRVKKADLHDDLEKVLQKAADDDRRVILFRETTTQPPNPPTNGLLRGGAAL